MVEKMDQAALDVTSPALREALSRHLAKAGKKTPVPNPGTEGGAGGTGIGGQLSARRGRGAVSLWALRSRLSWRGNGCVGGRSIFQNAKRRSGGCK